MIDNSVLVHVSPVEKLADFTLLSRLGPGQGIGTTRQPVVRPGEFSGDVHHVLPIGSLATVNFNHHRQLGVLVFPARERRATHAGGFVQEGRQDYAMTSHARCRSMQLEQEHGNVGQEHCNLPL